jgi:hypothetical protein
MGMGEIDWWEEGDPMINRILQDRDIFLRKRYFFQCVVAKIGILFRPDLDWSKSSLNPV